MRKRRILSLLMAVMIVVSSLPFTGQKAIAASGGSGTADDPYLITTASDFNDIRNDLNAYYEICSDIDLSVYTNWVPLGDVVHPFTGRIIGNGYKISGVTIGSSTSPSQAYSYTGLFGYISKYGVIQDLGIDVTIYNGSGSDCGGLAGKSEGYIVNCYVLGNVVSTAEDCNTGGLVGENAGNLVNCYGTASVTGGSRKYLANLGVGGLIGLSTGVNGVTNCYTTENVSGGEDSKVGAIVGYNYNGLVANCRWDKSASLRVNGSLVSPQAGANVGTGDEADINEASIRGLDTSFMKGSPAINIPYMKDIRETVIVTYLTFTEIMNLGRGAIDMDQLPSGVKASAWGQDSANTNNGYPIFSSASSSGGFNGGSGILTDPFIITTAAQLDMIRNDLSGHYKLGNDIDLSSIVQWMTIGVPYTLDAEFNGVLDGNGYKISNYKLGTPTSKALVPTGIFNIIGRNGVVKNLGLDCYLYSGSDGSGLVSDKNWGIIDNCYVTGEIEADAYAAALTIMNEGVIVNCYSTAKATGSNAGGFSFAHTSGGAMANCCATGDVSSIWSTGGFVSYLAEIGPINCYASGNVETNEMDLVFGKGAGGFGGMMPSGWSVAVNDYWNSSASQTMAGTAADPKNGIYYGSHPNPNLKSVGLTSEVMKGAPTSISYYKSQYESDGTVTANSFIEALNGGRGAIGKYFTTDVYNKKVLIHDVSLAEWAYVPGVNNDYPIPLTPQTPEITIQSVGKTISSGNTISFHAAAVVKDGGAVSYQWQKSSDGATWANVTDGTGTADTYITSALATGNSGETYRCVITNTLCGVTSDTTTDVATITVKPSILPLSQTVEAGNAVTFCVDSAGPYQWQVSTDGGISWSDITSAKLPYYTTKVLAASDSGTKYRCVIGKSNTGLTSQLITEAATVTVTDPTVTVTGVTLTPATVSVQKGGSYTFGASVTGTNNPSQSVTWSVDGSTNAGTSISAGVLTVAADETAAVLTVRATSVANSAMSGTATVTVTNVPSTVSRVIITPKTVTAVTGSAIIFSAAVAGTNNPSQTVTWSVDGNDSLNTAISNTGELSIAADETATALTVTAVSGIDNGKFDTATVTITSTPPPAATVSEVAITPDSVTISKGSIYSFSAAVTGTNNPSQAVGWSVFGNNNPATIINSSGVLAVAAGETATTLTVMAVSAADGTKSDTATVTVTDLSPTGPTVDAVTINPIAASVTKGSTKSFSAVVTGSNNPAQTVTWSIYGNISAGTGISSSGLLTVGADETAATLTVKAASTADSAKFGTAGVLVTDTTLPAATVSDVIITPDLVTVSKGSTYTFSAAVAGTNNPSQAVSWSVSGNNNPATIINSSGVLAIAAGETTATLTVIAASVADSTISDTAAVTVSDATSTDPTVDAVTINPTAASVAKGSTKSFSAVVTGSNNPAQTVIWSVYGNSSAATLISSSGLLTVGADETSTALTVSVVSTVNGSKAATAAVTVTSTSLPVATVLSVVVSTTTGSVQPGTTRTFTAAVAGTNNPSQTVTWSVIGKNSANTTISNTGVLTVGADETATSLTVTATSTIDSTKAGTATVTVIHADNTTPGTGGGGNSGTGGGSGSGGSSGGGSSSSDVTPTVQPEKKLDQPVSTGFSITAKVDKTGLATVEVSEQSITSAVQKAQASAREQEKTANGIGIAVNVKLLDTAKSAGIILTQPTLKTLIDAGVKQLEINGVPIAMSLDLEALREIQKQSNSNAAVTINFTPAAGLNGNAKTLIGTRTVYNISISYVKDGKTVNITSLGSGSVTLSIPYTPDKKEAAGYLFGVYVDSKGNATRMEGSTYDANSKSIIFDSNHFSVYGVGYTAPSATFKDISSHWAKESIDYVIGRGLFSSTSATAFSPDGAMSRGMLVTALGRLAGVNASDYKTVSFTDMTANKYYAPYIEWAYKKGIVSGTGSSQFAPDSAITREEIALILSNYAKATGYTLPVTRVSDAYADDFGIGSTYKNEVKAMQQAGIMMGGDGNVFNPKANATRAQVSAMLHRYIKLTIDPATAQEWAMNDAGQRLYYKDGKVLTGWQTIESKKYLFDSDGAMQTGWKQDDKENWYYISAGGALASWQNIGSGDSKKRYYFTKDGIMVSGKWLKIDSKWYYFNVDGSLAVNTKIDGYEVDKDGVRKTK